MRRFHQGLLSSYLLLKGGGGGGGGGRFHHLVPAVQHHHSHSHMQQVASYSSSSSVRPPWFSPTSMLFFYPGRTPLSFSSVAATTTADAATDVYAIKKPISKDLLPKEVVLYQYEASPFCNKIKAFLDYHDIPYKVLSKKEIKWSDYKKVTTTADAADAATDVYAIKKPISKDLLPKEVVLYQYEACPFCNKIKAFLDYYDIPYKVVEVNPLSKKEIKWSDYKKVPILMVDGEQMVDSSEIIDKLGHRLHPENKNYAESQRDDDDTEEAKWRRWVDNHLVHILSPNIYRSTTEALESFDYITSNGNFSFMERITVKYGGAAAMYFVSKKLKKKHNIIDERAALYEAAETWVNALDGRVFLGGSQPNLGDLAVFGVLRPIRYLRSGRDMVDHTRICEWYTRMEKAVGESSRINA